jgi:hypothetical protein
MREDRRGRWAFVATALSIAGLGVGLAWYAATALGAPAWEIVVVSVPLGAAALLVWRSAAAGDDGRALWAVAAGGAAAVFLLATFMFNEVGHRESLADLSTVAGHALRPDERLVLLGVVDYAPAFYTQGRLVVDETGEILVADSYEQVEDALAHAPGGSLLCITDRRRADEMASGEHFATERLGEQRDRVLLRLTPIASRGASSAPAERSPAHS